MCSFRMYKLVFKVQSLLMLSDEEEKKHAVVGHVHHMLLSPRTGRCVCVCVTCCTYRNGITPDM